MKYFRYFKNQAEAIDKKAYLPTVAIIEGINKVGYFNASDKTRQYKFIKDGDFIKIGEKETRLVCTYNVTQTTGATQLLYSGLTLSEIASMEIDGVNTTVATGYTFDRIGEHTVKYTFKDNTTISKTAFRSTSLTSVVIPDSVTSIGNNAFDSCSGLTSIKYNGTVAQWKAITRGSYWHNSVPSTTTVTCTDGDCSLDGEYIEDICLICAYKIDTIGTYQIAKYITDFAAMTVDGASETLASTYNFTTTGIHTIEFLLRDSTELSTAAFNEMTNSCLVSVTIPDTVTTLAKQLFRRCYKLTHITLSKNITEITEELLNECEGLVSLVIPDGVTSIDKHSLNHCYALTSLTIPSSVTYIGPYSLYRTESLSAIDFKGTKAQWYNISKQNCWKDGSKLSTIHCSDGDISL